MARKKKIRTLTRREHPCWGWCGQKLLAIVENGKLIGEIPPEAEFELRSAIGPTFVPAGAAQLKCQHNRLYIMMQKS